MATTTTFTATTLAAQYYSSDSRYSSSAAGQGACWRNSESASLVGVIGIPSLANVAWAEKTITAVNLTHTSQYNMTGTFRLYRSKKSSYDNVKGTDYLDTTGGYTDIASGGGMNTDAHTAALSPANIDWLQAQLRAGYKWFCIYWDGDSATSSAPYSAHYALASTWAFTITYDTRTYTVSYNKGAYGAGNNTSDTKTYGVTLQLKGAIFARTGYTQTGWAASDGGEKAYDLAGSYTLNQAITLYPYWSKTTYTIQYKPGSYSSVGQSDYSQQKDYGTNVTLRGITYNRSGYTQDGWSTTDGGAKTYDLYATYSQNANVTLYPSYTLKTYNVNYDKGTYGTGSNTTDTKAHGTSLTLRGAIFTRVGYTQTGWASDANGSTFAYGLGAEYTANSAVTLYPYWSINVYGIYYYPGYFANEESTYEQSKSYGVAAALYSAKYTRSGYAQDGWSLSQDGSTKDYDFGASYSTNESITLFPHWVQDSTGGKLHYMTENGMIDAQLYFMTENGLIISPIYVMQTDGTLELLQ